MQGVDLRWLIAGFAALYLIGCSAPEAPSSPDADQTAPPPLPPGAETVEFERPTQAEQAAAEIDVQVKQASSIGTVYWGVKDGEPLGIMWEDLMPEGSEEELMAEYERFYAMLEKRYAANTTTLANANSFAEIEEGSELDFMPQLGSFDTVEELDDMLIRIPGYIAPFDFESSKKHREFLFVPYMGACIHTPPPPPNQIIFVRADPAVRVPDIWAPYWIEGVLTTEKNENDLGNTAYALTLTELEPYPVLR